jgi:hypothetical protein
MTTQTIVTSEQRLRGGQKRMGGTAAETLPDAADLKPWKARRQKVRLEQQPSGQWFISGQDGPFFQATDYEASLWMDLQDARAENARLKAEIKALKDVKQ